MSTPYSAPRGAWPTQWHKDLNLLGGLDLWAEHVDVDEEAFGVPATETIDPLLDYADARGSLPIGHLRILESAWLDQDQYQGSSGLEIRQAIVGEALATLLRLDA